MDKTGLRGTLAARDFAPGDVIVAVPYNLTVAVGGHAALASVRAKVARAPCASCQVAQLAGQSCTYSCQALFSTSPPAC